MSALSVLYSNHSISALLKSQAFVEGVVVGVACSPEIPMPPEWMPWVFAEQRAALDVNDDDLWETITDGLVKTLRDTLSAMRANENLLPRDYEFDSSALSNSRQARWLTGLLFAHQQLQPVWQQAWDYMFEREESGAEEAADTLKHCLKVFSVMADPDLVLARDGQQGVRDRLPEIGATIPRALNQYIELANRLAEHLPNQFESFTQSLD